MTGTLVTKTLPSGKSYYYIRLSYKDPITYTWKSKTLSTKLEVKNNKRNANAMIKEYLEKYSYLEEPPANLSPEIDPEITLCDYMDLWLSGKKRDLRQSTYEGYTYRVNCIKRFFERENPKLIDVTPRMIDTYFKYALQYGKINQKTHKPEPLAVRSVRSYKSILYAVFNQAVIDAVSYTHLTLPTNSLV